MRERGRLELSRRMDSLQEVCVMQIKTAALIGLGAIGSFIAPRLNEALGPGNFKVVAKGA